MSAMHPLAKSSATTQEGLTGTSGGAGMGGVGVDSLLRRFGSGNSQSRPPQFSARDADKRLGWLRALGLFLANEDLGHTLTEDPLIGPVCGISSSREEATPRPLGESCARTHTSVRLDFCFGRWNGSG